MLKSSTLLHDASIPWLSKLMQIQKFIISGENDMTNLTTLWNEITSDEATPQPLADDWWYEDASLLSLPLYKRLIQVVELKRMRPESIASSLIFCTRSRALMIQTMQTQAQPFLTFLRQTRRLYLKIFRSGGYHLAEVAPDVNLKLPKFQSLAAVIPEYARPLDDGIYHAIDVFLKAHPWLQILKGSNSAD
ncbi:hypothetical protein DVH24_004637 [Malus domestica]|uniref:NPH3 domain-containing protein n=1 Tax=Malus domestica TaxID=3750 RepID=A0A498IHL7_MALDO|nr:hypothetical protein DVH24_004637 [Malus domestica]